MEKNINKENKYREASLLKACYSRNKDLVEYLVEYIVDINQENEYGRIPLFYACKITLNNLLSLSLIDRVSLRFEKK